MTRITQFSSVCPKFSLKLQHFLANLPFAVTEDKISAFFEKEIGPVVFSRSMVNKETGKGRGAAFVNFKDTSSVDLALNMTGLEFEGRTLRITKMMKKKQIAVEN